MNDSQKIDEIKKELEFLWVDDECNPLTGAELLDEALDNPVEYRELRNHLIHIQNIVFGK